MYNLKDTFRQISSIVEFILRKCDLLSGQLKFALHKHEVT